MLCYLLGTQLCSVLIGSASAPEITMKLSEGSAIACGADTSKKPSSTEVEIIFKCAKKVGLPKYSK